MHPPAPGQRPADRLRTSCAGPSPHRSMARPGTADRRGGRRMDAPANRKIPAMVMITAILVILRSFAVILSGVIVFAFRNDADVQSDSGLSSGTLLWLSLAILAVGILLLWG